MDLRDKDYEGMDRFELSQYSVYKHTFVKNMANYHDPYFFRNFIDVSL